jgi:hypothetical protein
VGRVGLDPRIPCRQGIWQSFRFSGHFWRFQTSIRTAISVPRTQIPCPAGAENWLRRAGNFLRQRRELTCQGREFAISVNLRLKIRHSTVDRPAPRRGRGRLPLGVRCLLCLLALPSSWRQIRRTYIRRAEFRGIDGPTATRLVPAGDGRGLIGRERLLRTKTSGGSMPGDQEMRQRRDRARHRPRLQCQPRHAFEVDELIATGPPQ